MARAPSLGAFGRAATTAGALLLVLAISAQAGISWTSVGALQTQAAESGVQLEAGAGANNGRYVKDFQISANKTGFTGEIKAKAGADMTLKDLVRARNLDDAPRRVTLRASQATSAHVEAFTFTVRDGGTTVATLDYKAASPSATFTLPAGTAYRFDLRIDLADGAGNDNAIVGVAFSMELT